MEDMNIYEGKKAYIDRYLSPAVNQTEADVAYLTYEWEIRPGSRTASLEIVTVHYYSGNTDRINVTANSLVAILHEVIREIDGHRAHGHIYTEDVEDENR